MIALIHEAQQQIEKAAESPFGNEPDGFDGEPSARIR